MKYLVKNDITKLIKNKLYLIGIIFVFLLTIYSVFTMPVNDECNSWDDIITGQTTVIMFVILMLVPFAICDDFKGGMVRNKIAAGFTRTQIYISGWITSIAASTSVFIAWALGFFPFAILKYGYAITYEDITPFTRVVTIFVYFVMTCTLATISHLVCVLFRKKAICLVILIITSIGYLTFVYPGMLMQQMETNSEAVEEIAEDNTVVVVYEISDNPDYVSPDTPQGLILYSVDAIIVPGQLMGVRFYNMEYMYRYLAFDVVMMAIYVAGGICFFRKKELK